MAQRFHLLWRTAFACDRVVALFGTHVPSWSADAHFDPPFRLASAHRVSDLRATVHNFLAMSRHYRISDEALGEPTKWHGRMQAWLDFLDGSMQSIVSHDCRTSTVGKGENCGHGADDATCTPGEEQETVQHSCLVTKAKQLLYFRLFALSGLFVPLLVVRLTIALQAPGQAGYGPNIALSGIAMHCVLVMALTRALQQLPITAPGRAIAQRKPTFAMLFVSFVDVTLVLLFCGLWATVWYHFCSLVVARLARLYTKVDSAWCLKVRRSATFPKPTAGDAGGGADEEGGVSAKTMMVEDACEDSPAGAGSTGGEVVAHPHTSRGAPSGVVTPSHNGKIDDTALPTSVRLMLVPSAAWAPFERSLVLFLGFVSLAIVGVCNLPNILFVSIFQPFYRFIRANVTRIRKQWFGWLSLFLVLALVLLPPSQQSCPMMRLAADDNKGTFPSFDTTGIDMPIASKVSAAPRCCRGRHRLSVPCQSSRGPAM